MKPPALHSNGSGTRRTARLRSVRRGVLEWSLHQHQPAGAELREMVRRFFAVPAVKRVLFERPMGRLRVDYEFGAVKTAVLGELSLAMRGETTAPLPEISLAAVNGSTVSIHRVGGVISSWRICKLAKDCVECHHEELRTCPAALLAVEEAVSLLRGVRRASVNRFRGTLTIWFNRRHFPADDLVSTLESAIATERPTAAFLPPTRQGYMLDAAQIASAALAPLAPFAFVPLSATLLAGCYYKQIRDAAQAAGKGRCDWNTVVTIVVGLTVWTQTFMPAALMSLALRGWRTLEHGRTMDAFSKIRRSGLPSTQVRRIAHAALSSDESERRSAAVANAAALPVLAFGVLGMFAGGPISALAAIRPDFLTFPRLGNRLERLRALEAFASRGVSLSGLTLCREFLQSTDLVLHPSCGDFEDSEFLKISTAAEAASLESIVQELPPSSPLVIYVGPALDWTPECRERILWCEPATEADRDWRHEADAVFEKSPATALNALLEESRRHIRRNSSLEKLPLAGNRLLTASGAFLGLAPWVIAAATNAITAAVWAGTSTNASPLRKPVRQVLA